MKSPQCLAAILPLLLANVAMPARGQTVPELTAEQKFEQRAIRTLQGRPGIAILGMVVIGGASPRLTNRLTNASVRDAAELILRRNGLPLVPSCEGGASNCGKMDVQVIGSCSKTDLLPSNDRLCTLYVRVMYLENAYSSRPGPDPSVTFNYRDFCPVWEDPFFPTITTEKLLEDKARQFWTEAIERFSLSYLRANPAK